MDDCDVHYNVAWVDAIDAAVKIINKCREDGTTDLREVRARVADLKVHAAGAEQQSPACMKCGEDLYHRLGCEFNRTQNIGLNSPVLLSQTNDGEQKQNR
jgi:hypothetical protein